MFFFFFGCLCALRGTPSVLALAGTEDALDVGAASCKGGACRRELNEDMNSKA